MLFVQCILLLHWKFSKCALCFTHHNDESKWLNGSWTSGIATKQLKNTQSRREKETVDWKHRKMASYLINSIRFVLIRFFLLSFHLSLSPCVIISVFFYSLFSNIPVADICVLFACTVHQHIMVHAYYSLCLIVWWISLSFQILCFSLSFFIFVHHRCITVSKNYGISFFGEF